VPRSAVTARRNLLDHFQRLVFHRFLGGFQGHFYYRRAWVCLGSLARELHRLRTAEQKAGIHLFAYAFERTALSVSGYSPGQLNPLTVTATVKQKAVALGEAYLSDRRLHARASTAATYGACAPP
jgi:hypothetical protein